MKKSITLISVLVLLASLQGFGIKPEHRILGYWEVVSYEKNGQTNHKPQERSKYIIFKKNGVLEGGRIGDTADKTGHWELSRDGKILVLSGLKARENGDYEILKLKKNELILQFMDNNILLDRGTAKHKRTR